MKSKLILLALSFVSALTSCNQEEKKLPILGSREPVELMVQGKMVIDTIYQTIPDFSFMDQDSVVIDNRKMADKIYVADFFFTSCPSICPIMKKQMLRVYKEFKEEDQLAFLSHTIDPKHDSIPVLKKFAQKLDVDGSKWHFLYGDKETVYKLARNGYMNIAEEDKNAPGGIMHSGYFILVDKKGQIRGAYNGTDQKEVNKLIDDIKILLKEYQE